MKQLMLDPGVGAVEIAELPPPALSPGAILVRNCFSVISPGTERSAVNAVRGSLLARARSRPDLVRRVLDTVRREGALAAYRKVQAKMSELQPLGYSSAGIVVAVGPAAGDYFRVGDRVACAGAGHASHAEVVAVPVNLAARVPETVPLEVAAFATLGAVALHGLRQSEPQLGERFAVIGLGVIGLLTVQLLRANGVRVIAFDLLPELASRAAEMGAESAAAGSADEQVAAALSWSAGVGVDGVIVAAATRDDAPMVAAAGMCRDRGRVTAIGLVPFGLPREIAYAKELSLRIGRSYGPGRYDPAFEENGAEYPIGFVRWTETRNLEAFLDLAVEGKVTPLSLVTHRVALAEAPTAYEALLAHPNARPLGILISYPDAPATPGPSELAPSLVRPEPLPAMLRRSSGQHLVVGCLGAGAFARSTLLPMLKHLPGVSLKSVVTAHGLTALDAQRRFGFEAIDTDPPRVIADPEIHLVVIATRHDKHAELATLALRAGKHVFVEKPLALDEAELRRVEEAAAVAPGFLMVGFNRRFSAHGRAIREAFDGRGPLMMSYRVNAGTLPSGHWLDDPQIGGGRIIGEACHFIDFMSFVTADSEIVSLDARAGRGGRASGNVAVVLGFSDGSIGQLLYTVAGSPRLTKEYLEVHGSGCSIVLEDFQRCTLYKGRRSTRIRGSGKGHREELAAVCEAVRQGGPSPIPVDVLMRVSRATLQAHRALGG